MNTLDQVKEQISRNPKPLPLLRLPKLNSIDDLKNYKVEDFVLDNYEHHPPIKAEMAV